MFPVGINPPTNLTVVGYDGIDEVRLGGRSAPRSASIVATFSPFDPVNSTRWVSRRKSPGSCDATEKLVVEAFWVGSLNIHKAGDGLVLGEDCRNRTEHNKPLTPCMTDLRFWTVCPE